MNLRLWLIDLLHAVPEEDLEPVPDLVAVPTPEECAQAFTGLDRFREKKSIIDLLDEAHDIRVQNTPNEFEVKELGQQRVTVKSFTRRRPDPEIAIKKMWQERARGYWKGAEFVINDGSYPAEYTAPYGYRRVRQRKEKISAQLPLQ